VDCYSCDQPAINACKRCAKPYCEDHGNAAYCAECLQPSSALPSFNLYRGALLVMLVGTAVAIFLILRPPGETKGAPPVVVGKSAPTATPASGDITPTVAARTPETSATAGTATAETTETPAAGSTPGATPSGTVSPFNEYTVEAGDTLFDIAQANLPPGDDVTAFARAIANLNNLDPTDPVLAIGQKLLLPKPR
jgi:LysM repeat protein